MSFQNPGMLDNGAYVGAGQQPIMNIDGIFPTAFARHDFWAGLHDADGVWLYKWGGLDAAGNGTGRLNYDTNEKASFRAFEHAMGLIKSDARFREALVNGEKAWGFEALDPQTNTRPWDSRLPPWLPSVVVTGTDVDPDDYGVPLGQIKIPHARVIWSAWRLGATVWFLATAAQSLGGDAAVLTVAPAGPSGVVQLDGPLPSGSTWPTSNPVVIDFSSGPFNSPIDAVVLRFDDVTALVASPPEPTSRSQADRLDHRRSRRPLEHHADPTATESGRGGRR